MSDLHILITGANGFLGKNLCAYLSTVSSIRTSVFLRGDSDDMLEKKLQSVDAIIHLAGSNRPLDQEEFHVDNFLFTKFITSKLIQHRRCIPIIFSSSIQVEKGGNYGDSKKLAESALKEYFEKTRGSVYIFRLPNIFGKWAKPNYNSVVATFCHNIIHDTQIHISDPDSNIRLAHVDDVCRTFLEVLSFNEGSVFSYENIKPEFNITVGDLASLINQFKIERESGVVDSLSSTFNKLLYSTYVSYLPKENFSFNLKANTDPRGDFVEILKSKSFGQVSFLTAKPGATRGGHYHNHKVERFLIIKGRGLFRFENVQSGDTFELEAVENDFKIIETIPGWAHDITNTGEDDLLCVVWANEVFDKVFPDTFSFNMTYKKSEIGR